jgi:hypothetical protein
VDTIEMTELPKETAGCETAWPPVESGCICASALGLGLGCPVPSAVLIS